MNVGEFLDSNRDYGDEFPVTSPAASNPGDESNAVEEQFVTSLTPSGIEVYYSWEPRRHYKIRRGDGTVVGLDDWVEIPSVTTVLRVLDRSGPMIWWGQGVGVDGTLELIGRGIFHVSNGSVEILAQDGSREWHYADKDNIVRALVQRQLSTNHVRDKAADRGTNIHSALEAWAVDPMFRPDPALYQEHEQGYVRGLCAFLDDLGPVEGIQAEVMVGSLMHGFAGRYDLRLTIPEPVELVTKVYAKRKPKVQEIPAGTWLMDLKTSKGVYETHAAQLAAYEMASVECGYGPTDHRAVIHVTEDGRYELVQTHAQPEDFLAILRCYQTMQGASKRWLS